MNCPRDGATLVAAPEGSSLGADAQACPRCHGASASPLGARWFLSQLGLTKLWPELMKDGEVARTGPSPLKCVRCGGGCGVLALRGVELDVCSACGAAWFDGGEVQRLSKPDRPGNVVGVFEMFWDCEFCDTKALLGKTNRFCPNCGAPQDAKRRYFPPPGKEVAANTEYDGVDLTCPACQTPNGGKAKACRQCGSPLNEAARVALVQQKASAVQPQQKAPPPTKSRWPWVLGGVGLLFVVFLVVMLTWKKDVTVTVAGHSWERVIDVEELRATSSSSWCDSMPSGAYGVSRHREQRSTQKVADGKDCHTENHDRGDGTFERREVCKTKYKDEPIYDDKCDYRVDRWEHARSVRSSGGLDVEPSWPAVQLSRACASLGCEREGPHHETYTVKLSSSEGHSWSCDEPQEQWRRFVSGRAYPMKIRVIGGGADCDSLKP